MTVIINELEVVVEQPAAQPPIGGGAPPLQPMDVDNIRERQTRMRLRTTAH